MKPGLPILLALLSLYVLPALADGKLPRAAQTFEIEGHKAYVYAAPAPAKGKPWLWYGPTLKACCTRAWALRDSISVKCVGCRLAARSSLFYDEMFKRGWSPKPTLLGQSRGGLKMLAWGM